MNWIQERLNTVTRALHQPIVPATPRSGVLQYCSICRPAHDIAEKLLREILKEITYSAIIKGQSDIMVRRQFVMMSYEPNTEVQKAYEREVRLL